MPIALKAFFSPITLLIVSRNLPLDLWKHVGPFVRVVAIAFSLENPNRAAADSS